MSTFRELFNNKMKEKGESLDDMEYWVGDLSELDKPTHLSAFMFNEISLYIYTKNYVYFPHYFTDYETETHIFMIRLPLPGSPEYNQQLHTPINTEES